MLQGFFVCCGAISLHLQRLHQMSSTGCRNGFGGEREREGSGEAARYGSGQWQHAAKQRAVVAGS